MAEIARLHTDPDEPIFLVGHSLGVPAILRYLEAASTLPIAGAVLVSGPSEPNGNTAIDNFLEAPFNFGRIKERCPQFAVIHGDNDPLVPTSNAQFLAEQLDASLVMIPGGGHLNGSAGWRQLPECLTALRNQMLQATQ